MRKRFENFCDWYVRLWDLIERRHLALIAEYIFVIGFALLFLGAACYGHSSLQTKLMTPDENGYTMYKIESTWVLPVMLHLAVIVIFTALAHLAYFMLLVSAAAVSLWICGAVYLVVAIPAMWFRDYCRDAQKKRKSDVSRRIDSDRISDVAGS